MNTLQYTTIIVYKPYTTVMLTGKLAYLLFFTFILRLKYFYTFLFSFLGGQKVCSDERGPQSYQLFYYFVMEINQLKRTIAITDHRIRNGQNNLYSAQWQVTKCFERYSAFQKSLQTMMIIQSGVTACRRKHILLVCQCFHVMLLKLKMLPDIRRRSNSLG